MTKRVDDIRGEDPFADQHEQTSLAQDLGGIAAEKIRQGAANSARSAGRRFLWSIPMAFSLATEYQKDRMLDRLERGERLGCVQMLFGERFGLGFALRWLLLLAFFGAVGFYLWQSGFFEQMMQQQALLDGLR